jgi:hypothetical protein
MPFLNQIGGVEENRGLLGPTHLWDCKNLSSKRNIFEV